MAVEGHTASKEARLHANARLTEWRRQELPMSSQCPHRKDGPPTVRDLKRTESAGPVRLPITTERGSRPYSRLHRIRPRHRTLRRPTLRDTAQSCARSASAFAEGSSCGTRSSFALRDTTMTVPAPPCPPEGAEPLAGAQPRQQPYVWIRRNPRGAPTGTYTGDPPPGLTAQGSSLWASPAKENPRGVVTVVHPHRPSRW